jgi:hypothetical protein
VNVHMHVHARATRYTLLFGGTVDIYATSLFLVSRRRERDSAANKMLPLCVRIDKSSHWQNGKWDFACWRYDFSCQDSITVIGKQGTTDEAKSWNAFFDAENSICTY